MAIVAVAKRIKTKPILYNSNQSNFAQKNPKIDSNRLKKQKKEKFGQFGQFLPRFLPHFLPRFLPRFSISVLKFKNFETTQKFRLFSIKNGKNGSQNFCWNCSEKISQISQPKNLIFCPFCKFLQPENLTNKHYFEILQIPKAFSVDLKKALNNYKTLQKSLHPDKFAKGNRLQKITSEKLSAMANSAIKTIKTPKLRAKYLLDLKGVAVENLTFDKNYILSIMTETEKISNATEKELKILLRKNEAKLDEFYNKIEADFENGDFKSAANTLKEIMFQERITNQIRDKL